MHKGMVADSRPITRGAMWVAAAVLLVMLLGGGVWVWSTWRTETPVMPDPTAPAANYPPVVAEEANDAGAMSPQALAQYRTFYAQQMVSEATLERWSLTAARETTVSPKQRAFYEQQMVSEDALRYWSPPVKDIAAVVAEPAAPIAADGVQFE